MLLPKFILPARAKSGFLRAANKIPQIQRNRHDLLHAGSAKDLLPYRRGADTRGSCCRFIQFPVSSEIIFTAPGYRAVSSARRPSSKQSGVNAGATVQPYSA